MKNVVKTILTTLVVLCFFTARAQQLSVSQERMFSSEYGIHNGDKFVIKPGKYERFYTTKNGFLAVDKKGNIDILDRNTAKKINKQPYRFERLFSLYIIPNPGRQNSAEYDHRFYILINAENKYALYDLDMNPITDFIYDGIYCYRHHSSKHGMEHLIIKKGDKYGLMLENGTITTEPTLPELRRPTPFDSEIRFNVFEVIDPKNTHRKLYYIHPDGKFAYGSSSLIFFNHSPYPFDTKGAIDYLISNLDSLRAEDKTILGMLNTHPWYNQNTPANLDEGFEWYVNAYKQQQNYHTTKSLAEFLNDKPQYITYLEQTSFYLGLLEYLSDFNNRYAYLAGVAYAYGKGVERDVDKAITYFVKATNTSKNVLYDEVVFSSYGELVKLYHEKGNTEKQNYYSNQYRQSGKKDDPLSGKSYATTLKVGQVIHYNHQTAAVASVSFDGVTLSDGRKIPAIATDYTILNASNDGYMVKCVYCYGSGKVTRTYKNVTTYFPTYTKTEYVEGTSIRGAQIKTATSGGPVTQDVHVEGQCHRCNGTGKIIPANDSERK